MIDNLKFIKPFLIFESDDDFYSLQIIQRRKENPDLDSNSRAIKSYYISSLDYLESRYDEIKSICNVLNARAMIQLNKRSYRNTAFQTMGKISDIMMGEDYRSVRNSYDSVVGKYHNEPIKKWIVDIDEVDVNPLMIDYIDHNCDPKNQTTSKIKSITPSKSGWHLITTPFNLKQFKDQYPYIDVHHNNPTNLYIP